MRVIDLKIALGIILTIKFYLCSLLIFLSNGQHCFKLRLKQRLCVGPERKAKPEDKLVMLRRNREKLPLYGKLAAGTLHTSSYCSFPPSPEVSSFKQNRHLQVIDREWSVTKGGGWESQCSTFTVLPSCQSQARSPLVGSSEVSLSGKSPVDKGEEQMWTEQMNQMHRLWLYETNFQTTKTKK